VVLWLCDYGITAIRILGAGVGKTSLSIRPPPTQGDGQESEPISPYSGADEDSFEFFLAISETESIRCLCELKPERDWEASPSLMAIALKAFRELVFQQCESGGNDEQK
jgi:hypothetical protein